MYIGNWTEVAWIRWPLSTVKVRTWHRTVFRGCMFSRWFVWKSYQVLMICLHSWWESLLKLVFALIVFELQTPLKLKLYLAVFCSQKSLSHHKYELMRMRWTCQREKRTLVNCLFIWYFFRNFWGQLFVYFYLVWFAMFGLLWFGLVWFGLVINRPTIVFW